MKRRHVLTQLFHDAYRDEPCSEGGELMIGQLAESRHRHLSQNLVIDELFRPRGVGTAPFRDHIRLVPAHPSQTVNFGFVLVLQYFDLRRDGLAPKLSPRLDSRMLIRRSTGRHWTDQWLRHRLHKSRSQLEWPAQKRSLSQPVPSKSGDRPQCGERSGNTSRRWAGE